MHDDLRYMEAAMAEARAGLAEGGIPIGSVLVLDGQVVGRGHNRRVQQGNAILHGEIDCLQNAGRLPASAYARATLYSTLSPCDMCSGAALLFKIPRVVFAENRTFVGAEALLRSRGVEVVNLDLPEAAALMAEFIRRHPTIWNEDIAV
jgi:cytosine deaminase